MSMMTEYQKKKILQKIQETKAALEVLRNARLEAVANGYSSASISSGGGSQSYTRYTPDQFTALIRELEEELRQYICLLRNGTTTPFRRIETVWS